MTEPASSNDKVTASTKPSHVRAAPPRPVSTRKMPLSPHLSIWRWRITMTASIAHRISILVLYVAVLVLAPTFLLARLNPAAYAKWQSFLGQPLFLPLWIILSLAAAFFVTDEIRHLLCARALLLDKQHARQAACASFAVALALCCIFWASI